MTKAINYNLNEQDLNPLPSDTKLERMVLGLFLDVPGIVEQLTKFVSMPGLFYNDQNKNVWEAIQKVSNFKMKADAKNVEGIFERLGDNDMVLYVKTLPAYSGEFYMAKQYCLKLFELAILRGLIRMSHDVNSKAYARNDALDLLAGASNGIGIFYEYMANMKVRTLADGIDELAEDMVEISNSPDGMLGLKGSISSLNSIFKGYRRGNLIIVGASAGEGKTTFAIQEFSFMATSGIPVGFISLEMTLSELLLKICCEKLSISVEHALSGKLTVEDMGRISAMLTKIKNLPIFINDTAALKIGEIKAIARLWKNKHKIKALYIDHLHLVNGDINYPNSEQKFTDIANQCKELAKELDIPVIALVQLARKDNLSEKRMHVMTDIKYAGGIEQAADVVLMIFRPEEHGIETTSDGESTKGKAIIKVDKLRLFEKKNIKCEFNGLRFTEIGFTNEWTGYTPPAENHYQDDNPF